MMTGEERSEVVSGMEIALHGLCQPLTVLHCKLELGLMSGEPEAMRQAIVDGIRECVRSNAAVAAMRELVRQSMRADEERTGDLG
jgi:hypothetical protein